MAPPVFIYTSFLSHFSALYYKCALEAGSDSHPIYSTIYRTSLQMFLLELNKWILGFGMNQNSWQHMESGKIIQAGSLLWGLLCFPGIPNRSVKEKSQQRGKSCSFCSPGTLHLPPHAHRLTENCFLPIPTPSFPMFMIGWCWRYEPHSTMALLDPPLNQTHLCSTAQSECGLIAVHSRSRGADTPGKGFVWWQHWKYPVE